MSKTKYVGAVDVDDTNFNVALINKSTGELIHFRTIATVGAMINKLKKNNIQLKNIQLCYEATYLGFSLYRELKAKGIKSEVIAPSLIPKKPGDKIKADRLDCISLSEYYLNGQLTSVYVPDKEDEMVRDFIRSRRLLQDQLKRIKKHFISLCKRMELDYRKDRGTAKASYWTQEHYKWIEKTINGLPVNAPLKMNLSCLLSSCGN